MNTDAFYQRIGELVVSFQWIETRIREIGWLILDPERADWPPKSLRNLTNEKLIDEVGSLYVGLLDQLNVGDRGKRKAEFKSLMANCHALRKYRNNLLHSAFIELKAGEDVIGVLRSNPKLKFEPEYRRSVNRSGDVNRRGGFSSHDESGRVGFFAQPSLYSAHTLGTLRQVEEPLSLAFASDYL